MLMNNTMLRSIIHKEALKLRMFWFAAFALNLAVLVYIYADMSKLFRMDHAEIVWYRVMHLGQMFYSPLMYVPMATGVFLAAAQFFPEMKNHRFRIALHLPLAPHLIVLGHVLVGLGATLVIFLVDMFVLCGMVRDVFPPEVVQRTAATVLPWMLAGMTAYIGTTLILLEPTWKLRVYNFLVSAGLAGMFLLHVKPGAYTHIIQLMMLLLLWFTPSVLLPAYRFRYRRG